MVDGHYGRRLGGIVCVVFCDRLRCGCVLFVVVLYLVMKQYRKDDESSRGDDAFLYLLKS